MRTARQIELLLRSAGTPERAKNSAWFFKTAPGEYGYGDKFYGVSVPEQRRLIRGCDDMSLSEVLKLLNSEHHESRLCACLIIVAQFKNGDSETRKSIYDFYLAHTERINNWDLVDSSASYIVGSYLNADDITKLEQLARSDSLWERRISMIATLAFIAQGEALPTFTIAEILLQDDQDLIHKAVGWMLREVGKRVDQKLEEDWLQEQGRYKVMPRTMLRYAIERFQPELRKKYLRGEI
ncbi:MAG: DNA alkylation repair protein [bacterium]